MYYFRQIRKQLDLILVKHGSGLNQYLKTVLTQWAEAAVSVEGNNKVRVEMPGVIDADGHQAVVRRLSSDFYSLTTRITNGALLMISKMHH